ncbi:heme exporter protein CcmD [Labrys okinawensis]|uniref:heme exporter protein CcmD n=1 Tax=Labrys okinawensis TaxID=346911 RepID=UPI0039BC9D37
MAILGMDLGTHWAFIVWAYAAALLVIVSLIVWVLADYRQQRKILADLEARGLRRRSRQASASGKEAE